MVSTTVTTALGSPDGGADLREAGRIEALFLQHLQKSFRPPARADHAEIGGFFPGEKNAETVGVVAVSAGDDDDVIKGGNPQPADAVFKTVAEHFRGIRKTAPVGKVRPVVHHMNLKTAFGPKLADRQGNVTAAEDDEPLPRHDRLTDGEEIAVIFGRHAGKAPALRICHGDDTRYQTALESFGDQTGFTPDDRLQRNGAGLSNMRKKFGIKIGHDDQLLLFVHGCMNADRDILS